jgi:hypothetical protein
MIEELKLRVIKVSQFDIALWTIWDWMLILILVVGAFFLLTKITVFLILTFIFILIVLLFSDEKFSFTV